MKEHLDLLPVSFRRRVLIRSRVRLWSIAAAAAGAILLLVAAWQALESWASGAASAMPCAGVRGAKAITGSSMLGAGNTLAANGSTSRP